MAFEYQAEFQRDVISSLEAAAVGATVLRGAVEFVGGAAEQTLLVRHAMLASAGDEGVALHLIITASGEQTGPFGTDQTGALSTLLDTADSGQSLSEGVRDALDDIWARDSRRSSGVLDAAEAAGQVVAGAPSSRDGQRAAALAAALCLARRGIVAAPYLTVWQLDAAARSAAVQVDRSQSWQEWVRAWCTLLTREAAALTHALRDAAAGMAGERLDVRTRARTGATDEAVLGWLHSRLRFTIAEAAVGLGLTTPTVGTAIERLAAKGYATELTGQLRDRVWVSTALLGLTTRH